MYNNKSVLVSDECYLEFGDTQTPTSILRYTDGDNTNILGVYSLSKRSSMAGYRAAFVVGDPQLIARILEVRKHAGMMVSLPVQRAMVAALSDSKHVAEQRGRYNARRALLVPALVSAGFTIDHSDAVIVGSEELPSDLTKYIESSGKPFLPFANKEEVQEKYTSFLKTQVL